MFNNDIAQKKFSSSKFIISPEGILKLIAIVLLLLSSIIFLTLSVCPGAPSWYSTLFPITTATIAVVCAILYVAFAAGAPKRGLRIWNIVDIILTMMSFIVIMSVSILTIVSCKDTSNSTELIPGPLAIIGSICLAISASVLFIKWRLDRETVMEDNNDEIPKPVTTISAAQYRKSVMI